MNQFDFNKLDKTKMYAAYFVPKNVKIFSAHFAIQLKAKQTVKKFKLESRFLLTQEIVAVESSDSIISIKSNYKENYATHSAMFVYLPFFSHKGKEYKPQWYIFESHIKTGVVCYYATDIQTDSDIYAYEEDLDIKTMKRLIGTEYGKFDMLGFTNEFLFPWIKKSRWHALDKGLFCTEYVEKCMKDYSQWVKVFGETAREPVMQQYLANISGKEIIKL